MAENQSTATHDETANEAAPPAMDDTDVVHSGAEHDGELQSRIEELESRLNELEAQAQANMDGWQRARAEFLNYKRRTTQELADARQRGALDALTKIIPIKDDFERSLDNIPEELQDHPWMNGTALILKNIQKMFDSFDVTIIDPVGEEFDPNYHEAVSMEDSDEYNSGVVTATLQLGYRSGDVILRPALVKVAN